MKGTSKVILGATLVMVISLAIVLGLVLVLLAELYCSLLRRRRHLKPNSATTNTTATTATATVQGEEESSSHSPLSSFYSQGVLQAPRNFLFPRLPSQDYHHHDGDLEMQPRGKLHQLLNFQTTGEVKYSVKSATETAHHRPTEADHSDVVDIEVASSPSPSFINSLRDVDNNDAKPPQLTAAVVYISNPVYDNNDHIIEESAKLPRMSTGAEEEDDTPPFETPDTSPSRVATCRVGDEKNNVEETLPATMMSTDVRTPPLSPIKDLPVKAVSVVLRDARNLGTSGSEEYSNNSQNAASYSTSSGSPRTSPSW